MTHIPNDIISEVERIVSPAYLVGGSVRDILRDQQPNDYDFATPLYPSDIEEKVRESGHRPFVAGKRFGTIGFKLGQHTIEITTFRTELYGSTRRPDVSFVDNITQDLSRRDFTINAIAIRGKRIIDPFDGRKDLKNHLIRAVGQPALRFNEDPLRMLRAARLAAQLNFTIDPHTIQAIEHHGFKIMRVSHERWMQELDKILLSDHAGRGLWILSETDLLKFLIPELRLQVHYDQNSPYHKLPLWEHSVSTTLLVPKDITMRWAALLHDVGKPFVRVDKHDRSNYMHHDIVGAQIVLGIGKRLRWSNDRINAVAQLVRNHMEDTETPLAYADAQSTRKVFDNLWNA